MTEMWKTCGWDGCRRAPVWDVLAINSYGRPGRAHAPCGWHLAQCMTEHYDAADTTQQDVWAWVVPFNPDFDDDYTREGEYGDDDPCGGKGWLVMATNGDGSRDWIERDDECQLFDNDADAAVAASLATGRAIAYATPIGCEHTQPYLEELPE